MDPDIDQLVARLLALSRPFRRHALERLSGVLGDIEDAARGHEERTAREGVELN